MGPAALSLVLLSTCLHAGWNLIGKRRAPSMAFFTLAMGSGGVIFSPLLLGISGWGELPPAFWAWLALSGLFQTLYMGGLAWAYASGEMSTLYPLARALPVMLVALVSVGLLGGRLGPAGLLGILLILAGALLLTLAALPAAGALRGAGLGFALLAALATAGYTLVDKQALTLMTLAGHAEASAGAGFMVLQALVTPLWALPLAMALPEERRRLAGLLRREWRMLIVTGVMITGTYGLVLVAMALTDEVSLVVALRQLSIPLGVLAGILILKEGAGARKLAATGLMLIGLVIVSLA